MPRIRTVGIVLAVVLVGCQQKLDLETTKRLGSGDVLTPLIVEGPRKDQKVTVAMTSSACPINVYLLLEEDQKAAERSLERGKPPAKLLASKEKVSEATLEATVPARKGYAVMISGATQATDIKLKVTGR